MKRYLATSNIGKNKMNTFQGREDKRLRWLNAYIASYELGKDKLYFQLLLYQSSTIGTMLGNINKNVEVNMVKTTNKFNHAHADEMKWSLGQAHIYTKDIAKAYNKVFNSRTVCLLYMN